jgi:phosphatidylserine/phosphatidylglycerophosphate/cardiolipin synthase-like enzyme
MNALLYTCTSPTFASISLCILEISCFTIPQGRVAHDGHLFANYQWRFVERRQSTCYGCMVDKLPDNMPMMANSRVTVSEFPRGQATEFPPYYKKRLTPMRAIGADEVPMISMGRYGSVLRYYRPSDDAFLAMFDSAKKVIRMSLQDLGPVRIPNTTITLPGCVWPKKYLAALGRAIWKRNVNVEIVLSNPHSHPGGLKTADAEYGNGWSCVDVAAEIIKTIRKQFPNAADLALRIKVEKNLRVCFIRRRAGNKWDNGTDTLGLHSKHFIIDDICTYIGSQNLYVCDLAEWGVVIDHAETVRKIMSEYWIPMWAVSFTGEDCNVQQVMDGLDIDRGGEPSAFFTREKRKQQMWAAAMASKRGSELFFDVDED